MITITMAGVVMSPSYAKPDLTKTVDMSLLHAKDIGYRFVYIPSVHLHPNYSLLA